MRAIPIIILALTMSNAIGFQPCTSSDDCTGLNECCGSLTKQLHGSGDTLSTQNNICISTQNYGANPVLTESDGKLISEVYTCNLDSSSLTRAKRFLQTYPACSSTGACSTSTDYCCSAIVIGSQSYSNVCVDQTTVQSSSGNVCS